MPDKVNEVPMPEMTAHELAGQAEKPKSSTDAKAQTSKLLAELAHLEAKLLPGAPDLTPKEALLDLSELHEKNPELHFCWTNIRAPNKADTKRSNGYIRLPEAEGGREIGGELAIFVTTKRLHEARVERIKKLAKARLTAHVDEMQAAAEKIAAEMKSQYGVAVDVKRLFVSEGG